MDLPAVKTNLIEVAKTSINSILKLDIYRTASAALPTNRQVCTGVNVFHFAGGPCAELVILGVAAGAGIPRLSHLVIVGEDSQGLFSIPAVDVDRCCTICILGFE
ncbi:APOBEC/CMP deaminase zinc-binding [Penicillium paradoxum]|uniref:APOBEC/CMP deaminase zinc-binding n=1 Tax=Penicillium paradoxum TaxID=176176 RepID=UPI00254702B9|nr:APOBEC/CMP deaminase zinc-binding [Penicillium paradoxum]KAJ5778843.1 APOBEC/CMP deaminase zinc-binding [Penicillium paradoxum]